MSEAIEQVAIRKSPLDEAHRLLGASFKERDGCALPASYGDVSAEYAVVREGGAGLIDLSSRGLLEVSGTEAPQFLNGLVTNDVKTLAEGAWMLAAFPNAQGRLVAFARIMRLGDSYLFDTEAAAREHVYKTLARFTLAGDFRVRDLTDETALVSVQGALAATSVGATLGFEAARLERGRVQIVQWNDQAAQVIRATHTSEDGFDIFTSAAQAPLLWGALLTSGAQPVGFDALEILRIEAGIPRHGVDMNDSNVITETGLDEAVSYTKGCYIGQEIIARIHWRGHVAKRLAGLSLDDGLEIEPTASVKSTNDKEIGRITSTAFSPRLNRAIALGYVKYDYLKPGTQVRIIYGAEQQQQTAHVHELPFVRGGWYEEAASGAEQQQP